MDRQTNIESNRQIDGQKDMKTGLKEKKERKKGKTREGRKEREKRKITRESKRFLSV